MDAQLSILMLPDLVIQLIIWKFLESNSKARDISNISRVCKVFREIVFSKPFQHFLHLEVNNYKFPYLSTTDVEFRFIQKLRSAGNEYATLLLAMHNFFFQDNYESISTLSELASSSNIDLAHYIYGIALLCLGEHGQGQSVLSNLSMKLHNHPKGWFAWQKCRYGSTLLLGDANLHKVPQTIICSVKGPGHVHSSISNNTIFIVKLTCAQCVAYVETTIIRKFVPYVEKTLIRTFVDKEDV